jgi:hypothetical protein
MLRQFATFTLTIVLARGLYGSNLDDRPRINRNIPVARAQKEAFGTQPVNPEKTYAELSEIYQTLQAKHLSRCRWHDSIRPCMRLVGEDQKAIDQKGEPEEGLSSPYYVFKRPFPTEISLAALKRTGAYPSESGFLDQENQGVATASWAPSNEVEDGQAILEKARQLAESQAFFDCHYDEYTNDELREVREYTCSFVALALNPPTEKSTELLVCQVSSPAVESTAPTRCVPFIVYDQRGAWIAVVRTVGTSCECGGPDQTFDLAVFAPLDVEISDESVVKAVTHALTASPLLLDVKTTQNGLVGIRKYQTSLVLNGWNEYVRVTLDTGWVDCSNPNSELICHGFHYSAVLYINKQKDSDPNHWSMPEDPLYTRYEDSLKRQLKKALLTLCPSGKWHSDTVLVCHSLP